MGFDDRGIAANHEDQGSINRCRLAAGYRGIQEGSAETGYGGSNFLDKALGDRTAVNDGHPALQGAKQTVLSVEYIADGLVVAYHGNNKILSFSRFTRRLRNGGSLFGERTAFFVGAVIHGHIVILLQQIGGHGSAHGAQSDKPDFFIAISPSIMDS